MSARALIGVAALAALAISTAITAASTAPQLDYEFFKSRVEPVFLTKRPDHARCYVCHVESNNAFHLERLAPGEHAWTEEQSRRNFETVSNLVNPGDPNTSRLLLHPLAPEGGGDVWHSGGRQFANRNDPYWKTIYAWAKGAKLSDEKKK